MEGRAVQRIENADNAASVCFHLPTRTHENECYTSIQFPFPCAPVDIPDIFQVTVDRLHKRHSAILPIHHGTFPVYAVGSFHSSFKVEFCVIEILIVEIWQCL
jgi:hypothetical protein